VKVAKYYNISLVQPPYVQRLSTKLIKSYFRKEVSAHHNTLHVSSDIVIIKGLKSLFDGTKKQKHSSFHQATILNT
jgi:cobyrinic acid a,c-diamide synthase